jgi:uncharacterized protein YbaP (TraB family)
MKKLLACTLLILVLIAALVACDNGEPEQTPTPEPTPEVTLTPEPEEPDEVPEYEEEPEIEEPAVNLNIHGAIHRIEYGDNVVYLFGSLHGGRDNWYPLADVVEDAMNRADIFATEIGLLDEIEQVEAITAVAMLPDGQTWVDFLPQEAYEHMVEIAAAWDMDYEEVNTMNPVFLIFTLEVQFLQLLSDLELGGNIGDLSVDGYVMQRAVDLSLPVIGLETIEQQAQILYVPPFEVTLSRVMSWLAPDELMEAIMESPEPSLDELADLYEANDLVGIAGLFSDSISLEAEAEADGDLWLVYMREYVMNWRSTYYANVIAGLLRETEEPTTFFIVVGLSHIVRSLAGEEFTDIVQQLGILGIEAVPIWE